MTLPMPAGPVIPGSAPLPARPVRRARGWDILLTVLFLVGALVLGLVGAFYGMLALAFMDTCPPEGCSGDAIYVRWVVGALLWTGVLAASIVVLVLRRRAWWVALIGLVGMFVLWSDFFVSSIAYSLS